MLYQGKYTDSAHVNKAHGGPSPASRVCLGGGGEWEGVVMGGLYQTALLFHSSHTAALSLSGLPDMLIGV